MRGGLSTSLDWELYRALYRTGDDPFWSCWPHPDLALLSKALGTTRTTVWRRLKEWRRIGFIGGYEVIPNPSLMGVGLMLSEVQLSDARSRQSFLNELELIDGVFVANYDLGPRTTVVSVADMPASRARRAELLARIPGVESVRTIAPVWLPRCRRPLTAKEWKFLGAVRESPESSLLELSRKVGVSAKTFSRRYQAVREAKEVLSYRIEDFSRFPGTIAMVIAHLDPRVDPRAVAARVLARLPTLTEIASITSVPFSPQDRLGFCALVPSASSLEPIEAGVLEVPGVVKVRTRFRGGERAYRGWFDERIHQAIGGAAF